MNGMSDKLQVLLLLPPFHFISPNPKAYEVHSLYIRYAFSYLR